MVIYLVSIQIKRIITSTNKKPVLNIHQQNAIFDTLNKLATQSDRKTCYHFTEFLAVFLVKLWISNVDLKLILQ